MSIREDIRAYKKNDPAARSSLEVLLLYNGLHATIYYRISHWLYGHKCYFLARMVSQHAKRRTGVEIHPAAKIGKRLVIDHGTGIVIGETTIIGDNVKMYQGATLGALSPAGQPCDSAVRRHPKVGNNVTIYAGSTLLGGATEIGDNVVIGGNAFLTSSVEADTTVSIVKPEMRFRGKKSKA